MPPNQPATSEPKTAKPATSQDEDALFIVPPPPAPEPISKGKLALIIGVTMPGVLAIIAAVLLSLSVSAKQSAYNYDRAAANGLAKLDSPLKDLNPSSVLNRRDVSAAQATIKNNQQSQASLPETLLGSVLNSNYKRAAQLESDISAYYQNLLGFTSNMDSLVTFSDTIQSILTQQSKVVKLTNNKDQIALRSAAGSISGDAQQVSDANAPAELNATKKQIINAINQKSKAYQAWAVAVEKHKPAGIKAAKQQISQANKAISLAASDAQYAKAFASRYSQLQKQQAALKRQTAL